MRSVEIFTEEMSMKLREFRWLIGESSTLHLTVIRRAPHGTERLARSIVSCTTEASELIREDIFIILDIMPTDDIRTIEHADNIIHIVRHHWSICDILIVDTIHLGCSERDRNRWLYEEIMACNLSVDSIGIISLYRSELDDIWLLREISPTSRESCSFCIPDSDFHTK